MGRQHREHTPITPRPRSHPLSHPTHPLHTSPSPPSPPHHSFYFVSDPTLLEILSLGSDPPSVVPHFQSGLFDSLAGVTFAKGDKTRMLEMASPQGERVEFERPVDAKGNIEVWLQRLVDGMQGAVKHAIRRAVRGVYDAALQDFIFAYPAQVALLGVQFQWTADTQAALAAAKTDKAVMAKNLKKTDALLRCGGWAAIFGGGQGLLCCLLLLLLQGGALCLLL